MWESVGPRSSFQPIVQYRAISGSGGTQVTRIKILSGLTTHFTLNPDIRPPMPRDMHATFVCPRGRMEAHVVHTWHANQTQPPSWLNVKFLRSLEDTTIILVCAADHSSQYSKFFISIFPYI